MDNTASPNTEKLLSIPILCCIDSVGQCIHSIYFPNVCVYIKKIQLTRTAFLGIPLKSVDNIVKNYK